MFCDKKSGGGSTEKVSGMHDDKSHSVVFVRIKFPRYFLRDTTEMLSRSTLAAQVACTEIIYVRSCSKNELQNIVKLVYGKTIFPILFSARRGCRGRFLSIRNT